jgi:hypothetical protein
MKVFIFVILLIGLICGSLSYFIWIYSLVGLVFTAECLFIWGVALIVYAIGIALVSTIVEDLFD